MGGLEEAELSPTHALVITVVVLAASWLFRAGASWLFTRMKLSGVPRPPGSVPFLGHALALGTGTPWDTMIGWINQYGKEESGRLIAIDFLMQQGVIMSDPAHIKHVMDKKQRNYPKDLALAYKHFMHILGKGLVTSSGQDWKRQRKQSSSVMRIDILQETTEVAKRAVDRLSKRLEAARGTGKPVEIAEEFRIMTLQVIGELILSLPPDESERVFPELYLPIVEEANIRVWQPWRAWLPTPHYFKFNRTVAALNEYVSNLVRARWAKHQEARADGREPPLVDILDRLVSSVDPAAWGESCVTQLRDEIKTFILAGHETSASMLTWSVYELTQNPEVLEKVLAEGRKIFPDTTSAPAGDRDKFQTSTLPTKETLKDMNYTVHVLKESLRLYTLVPMVTRECLEDDVIDGQTIPAGTKIFINLKAVHTNPKLWPEPEKFRPERFEEDFDMWNFNAFINGPRNCIGQHLALMEARIVLSLLMQRFKFTPANSKVGEVHAYMVPTCPANGMHMLID